MSGSDADVQRAQMLERWERAAGGWGRRADRLREPWLPVSAWMIEHLELAPGRRVLELAAGPGDTGFLAAELVSPGGTLICSDASEAMLEVARSRADALGIENVEFRRLSLEWIDLPTASVDAVLCRWGFMLSIDPAAAMQEARRVLAPGGRLALAVWDDASTNPWATVPGRAMVGLGHAEPPDRDAPGMFALAAPGKLEEMLHGAGFVEVLVDAVELDRGYDSLDAYIEETVDLSSLFAEVYERCSDRERAQLRAEIDALAQPFATADGSLRLTGRSLVAVASG